MVTRMVLIAVTLATPCLAQLDRATFLQMASEGRETALIELVREQCVGFRFDKEVLDQVADRPELTLAVLQCLYDRAPATPAASVLPSEPAAEAAPAPAPAVSYAPADAKQIYLQKTIETLNSLDVADRMSDSYQRVKTLSETKTFLVNMLSAPDYRLTPTDFQAHIDRGFQLPDWARGLMTAAESAKRSAFPSLSFEAARRLEFTTAPTERGLDLFMGLYMVRELPKRGEPYRLEDQFMFTHAKFPIEYDGETKRYQLHQLKTKQRQARVQYSKYLNKLEPLQLFPGNWVFRAAVYNKAGKVHADDYYGFTVEPGTDYALRLFWVSQRPGVRDVGFELVTR